MISAIVPSYKNPQSLQWCLKSFVDTNSSKSNELICVIDGYGTLYDHIIENYRDNEQIKFLINNENRGMPFSINIGVFNAKNTSILVLNDDNVFPKNWDNCLLSYNNNKTIISPNQIEKFPSIFNFIQYDFGGIHDFRYQEFLDTEPSFRQNQISSDGGIFPFFMTKKLFMIVGGFDLIYPSPFICDWDFFLKLELLNIDFYRTRNINFYHFGSVSTKNSNNTQDAIFFHNSENLASEIFLNKWGFRPHISRPSNSHKPNLSFIKGISYDSSF